MNEIPLPVSFAVAQLVAAGSAFAAFGFWRSAGLARIFTMWAMLQKERRSRPMQRFEVIIIYIYVARLAMLLGFVLLALYGYNEVARGSRNAYYFFEEEKLDSGAGAAAIRNVLLAARHCSLVTLYASSLAFGDWVLEGWLAKLGGETRFGGALVELPHGLFFRGERFSEVIDLWQTRFLYCVEELKDAQFKSVIVRVGSSDIKWEEFATGVCLFRERILRQAHNGISGSLPNASG